MADAAAYTHGIPVNDGLYTAFDGMPVSQWSAVIDTNTTPPTSLTLNLLSQQLDVDALRLCVAADYSTYSMNAFTLHASVRNIADATAEVVVAKLIEKKNKRAGELFKKALEHMIASRTTDFIALFGKLTETDGGFVLLQAIPDHSAQIDTMVERTLFTRQRHGNAKRVRLSHTEHEKTVPLVPVMDFDDSSELGVDFPTLEYVVLAGTMNAPTPLVDEMMKLLSVQRVEAYTGAPGHEQYETLIMNDVLTRCTELLHNGTAHGELIDKMRAGINTSYKNTNIAELAMAVTRNRFKDAFKLAEAVAQLPSGITVDDPAIITSAFSSLVSRRDNDLRFKTQLLPNAGFNPAIFNTAGTNPADERRDFDDDVKQYEFNLNARSHAELNKEFLSTMGIVFRTLVCKTPKPKSKDVPVIGRRTLQDVPKGDGFFFVPSPPENLEKNTDYNINRSISIKAEEPARYVATYPTWGFGDAGVASAALFWNRFAVDPTTNPYSIKEEAGSFNAVAAMIATTEPFARLSDPDHAGCAELAKEMALLGDLFADDKVHYLVQLTSASIAPGNGNFVQPFPLHRVSLPGTLTTKKGEKAYDFEFTLGAEPSVTVESLFIVTGLLDVLRMNHNEVPKVNYNVHIPPAEVFTAPFPDKKGDDDRTIKKGVVNFVNGDGPGPVTMYTVPFVSGIVDPTEFTTGFLGWTDAQFNKAGNMVIPGATYEYKKALTSPVGHFQCQPDQFLFRGPLVDGKTFLPIKKVAYSVAFTNENVGIFKQERKTYDDFLFMALVLNDELNEVNRDDTTPIEPVDGLAVSYPLRTHGGSIVGYINIENPLWFQNTEDGAHLFTKLLDDGALYENWQDGGGGAADEVHAAYQELIDLVDTKPQDWQVTYETKWTEFNLTQRPKNPMQKRAIIRGIYVVNPNVFHYNVETESLQFLKDVSIAIEVNGYTRTNFSKDPLRLLTFQKGVDIVKIVASDWNDSLAAANMSRINKRPLVYTTAQVKNVQFKEIVKILHEGCQGYHHARAAALAPTVCAAVVNRTHKELKAWYEEKTAGTPRAIHMEHPADGLTDFALFIKTIFLQELTANKGSFGANATSPHVFTTPLLVENRGPHISALSTVCYVVDVAALTSVYYLYEQRVLAELYTRNAMLGKDEAVRRVAVPNSLAMILRERGRARITTLLNLIKRKRGIIPTLVDLMFQYRNLDDVTKKTDRSRSSTALALATQSVRQTEYRLLCNV